MFLNVSGLSADPVYTAKGRSYYVVFDEGITDDRDGWYYYLVTLDNKVFSAMTEQYRYFQGYSDDPVPYTLYGVAIVPSDEVKQAIMESYQIDQNEYNNLFGRSCLQVNKPVTSRLFSLGMMGMITAGTTLLILLITLLDYMGRRKRVLNSLNQQGYLHQAAEELAGSIYSRHDPFMTDNYLFNRSTCTIVRLKDIWMVYPSGKILYGISKYNISRKLASNNRNGIHDEIIARIRELNPQLLVGNTEQNRMAFEKMLLERIDDLEENKDAE